MSTLQSKKVVVAEVSEIAKAAHSLVLSEYRGLTVAQITQLRKSAREQNVDVRVVKNTLAKRALADTTFECVVDHLVGPLILAFSMNEDDPSAAARVVNNFVKDKANEKLVVTKLVFEGEVHDASSLNAIATLPTKDEAISMLLAVLKAPVQKLAATLQSVKEQKEAA